MKSHEFRKSSIKNLNPKQIPDDVISGDYSLTISMLIASQMVSLPIIFSTKKIQEALHGSFDLSMPEEYLNEADNLSSRVLAAHSSDLIRWTKPGGRILFIDTINRETTVMKAGKVVGSPECFSMFNKEIMLHPLLSLDPAPETASWKMANGAGRLSHESIAIVRFNVSSWAFRR